MDPEIRSYLQSQETYPQTKKFRTDLLSGDKHTIRSVQITICALIKDKNIRPITKILAAKFAKDCVETFNEDIINQFQQSVLPIFEQIANSISQYKQDQNSGKYLFSDQPTQQQESEGNSFLTLILECIRVWSKWFPVDPQTNKLSCYKVSYQKLVTLGVQFPTSNYFSFKTTEKHMPEQMIPRTMLKECKEKILYYTQKNNGKQPNTKTIVDSLKVTLISCVKKNHKNEFYTDIMERCIQKLVDQSRGQKKSQNKKPIINQQQSLYQSARRPTDANYFSNQIPQTQYGQNIQYNNSIPGIQSSYPQMIRSNSSYGPQQSNMIRSAYSSQQNIIQDPRSSRQTYSPSPQNINFGINNQSNRAANQASSAYNLNAARFSLPQNNYPFTRGNLY